MPVDIFGDILDVDTIETALRETLQERLPEQLAHQERRRDLPEGALIAPRSWPTVSEFELENSRQLPAIVIVSAGSLPNPQRRENGTLRKTWRFEVAVVTGDRTETEARANASRYLAAVIGAVVQNQTLGGVARSTRNVGPDDHAYGPAKGDKRQTVAIYGTAFEVTVTSFMNERLGPTEPLPDPYTPPDPVPDAEEATITVQYLEEDTP